MNVADDVQVARIGAPGVGAMQAEQPVRIGVHDGLLMGAIGLGAVLGALAGGCIGQRQQAVLIFVGWGAWGACFAMLGLSSVLVQGSDCQLALNL